MLYRVTVKVGRRCNSKIVEANALHHRSDALSSLLAMAGIVGSMVGYPALDSVAAMVVAGLVIKMGAEIAVDSFRDLTDQQVGGSLEASLQKLVADIPELLAYHQLRLRRMGPFIYADLHIIVDSHLSVSAAHQVAERLRVAVHEQFPEISEILVHVDPEEDQHVEQLKDPKLVPLMRPHRAITKDVIAVFKGFPAVDKIHKVTTHFLRGQVTLDVVVSLDSALTLQQASEMTQRMEHALAQHIPDVHRSHVYLNVGNRKNSLREHQDTSSMS